MPKQAETKKILKERKLEKKENFSILFLICETFDKNS